MKIIICFLLFPIGFLYAKLPFEVIKCRSKDIPCLKTAIQDLIAKLKDGVPDQKIPGTDPILIDKMVFPAGDNIVKVRQNFEDLVTTGASATVLKTLDFNLDKGIIAFDFFMPYFQLNATYNINGTLLVFPVFGNGKTMLHLEKLNGRLAFKVETYEKNKEKYLRATDADFKFNVEHAIYKFDNLFNGNELLGDNINKVINENWREIFNELIPFYTKAYGLVFLDIMNKAMTKLPFSDMYLD